MVNKKFYWLKFQQDFFKSLRIKRLRKLAGGDTFTIIYLKLQLLALNTDGLLEYKGIFESFEAEMAEEIDEEEDNVRVTIQYLLSCGLMVQSDKGYYLPYVSENTGSETKEAIRKREYRNGTKLGQSWDNVPQIADKVGTELGQCPTEKEIEKEIDIEIEKDINKGRFKPPTIDEISDYCLERGNNVDAEAFYDFYQSKGWMVGKNKMKDWKSAVRTWERSDRTSYKSASRNKKIDWDNL